MGVERGELLVTVVCRELTCDKDHFVLETCEVVICNLEFGHSRCVFGSARVYGLDVPSRLNLQSSIDSPVTGGYVSDLISELEVLPCYEGYVTFGKGGGELHMRGVRRLLCRTPRFN